MRIVNQIVKYAVRLTDPSRMRYELEKAVSIALSGRKGPVLLDIPMDIQRAEVETEALTCYGQSENLDKPIDMTPVLQVLNECIRPVVLVGGSVRLGGASQLLNSLVKRLGIQCRQLKLK